MPALSSNNPFDVENRGTIPERTYNALVACHFTNLETGMSLQSMFLPSELEEALEVFYERASIPGHSHQPLQYKGTGNQAYPITLYWRVRGEDDVAVLDEARKFLMSLCYPTDAADSVVTGAPARVLFVWPGMVAMKCRITALSFSHFQFAQVGPSTAYTVRVTIEEIPERRMLAEDIRLFGPQRGRREDYPEDIRGLEWYSEEEVPATGPDEEAG